MGKINERRVDKILALKAFYLGSKIRQFDTTSKNIYLIDQAIILNKEKVDSSGRRRACFYQIIKAEAERIGERVTSIRAIARELSENTDSEIFDNYMSIVEATQTIKKTYGEHIGIISDEGILRRRVRAYNNEDIYGAVHKGECHKDEAINALGLVERTFSDFERKFLFETELNDIINGVYHELEI